MRRWVVEVAAAVLAAVGAVAAWLAGRSQVVVAPILEGEPSTTSQVFDAPMMTLSLLLAALAGVLVVLAISRRRRHTHPAVAVPAYPAPVAPPSAPVAPPPPAPVAPPPPD